MKDQKKETENEGCIGIILIIILVLIYLITLK